MGEDGKRVSWVELYLDLVFVLAVGQLAHLIVAQPEMRSVWIALGLFFTLWWTWVGFAVIYNRLGDDVPAQRLLFLAASVPIGVAAVAIEPTSTGASCAATTISRRSCPTIPPRRSTRTTSPSASGSS
jgi:low temperature requirement protein LtrA